MDRGFKTNPVFQKSEYFQGLERTDCETMILQSVELAPGFGGIFYAIKCLPQWSAGKAKVLLLA